MGWLYRLFVTEAVNRAYDVSMQAQENENLDSNEGIQP